NDIARQPFGADVNGNLQRTVLGYQNLASATYDQKSAPERPGSAPDSERAAGIAKPNRNGSRNASLERAVALRQLAAYGYAAAPWSLAAFGRTARPGLTAWGCRTRVRYPAGLSPTGQLIRTRSGCPAARRNLALLGRAAGPGRAGCWYPTEFGHPAG